MKTVWLLFFTMMSVSLISHADPCPEKMVELTSGQREALRATLGHDYIVHVMRGTVANKSRMVVFVGESHVKSTEDSEIGKKILQEFKNRGVEGLDPANYWASNLIQNSVSGLYGRTGKRSKGSSVYQAMAPHFKQYEPFFIDGFIEQIKSGNATVEEIKSRIEKLKAGGLTQKQLNEIGPMGQILELMDWDSILSQFEAKVKTTNDIGSPGMTQIVAKVQQVDEARVFQLEANHKPSFAENLKMLIGGVSAKLGFLTETKVCIAAAVCGVAATVFLPHKYTLAAASGIAAYWGLAVLQVSSRVLSTMDTTKYRDPTMAKNITKTFEENPEVDVLLVIVGKNHVPGVAGYMDNAGFDSNNDDWRPSLLGRGRN